ncbi:MAG: CYTH domain-containing protein [Synechococcaceae cyanobacterium]|nr:CYTH domain-containing protein [Synechococcaceae cyanobacterium]
MEPVTTTGDPMALEIERRFLVKGSGWRDRVCWQARLSQGYLCSGEDGFTLRVRLSAAEPGARPSSAQPLEQAWLTIKAALPTASAPASAANCSAPSAQALTRLEFEYAIPLADGQQLLNLAGSHLAKRRYGLDLPDGVWVVDVFEAENAPLVVAEVELPHADAAFNRPDWCGAELTGWHQLSNAALAQHPLNRWSAPEREALLAGKPLWRGAVVRGEGRG